MGTRTLAEESVVMEKRRISVSEKRQITIPKRFFDQLGIGNEVECVVQNGGLFIRPVPASDDFSEEILKDLLESGVPREHLLEAFQTKKKELRTAVQHMIADADEAAKNYDGRDELAELWED